MRRVLVGLAAMVVLAAPPAAGGEGEEAPSPLYPGITEMLERRADALLSGDRDAFMATVDPSSPAFARRQRLLFDGFQRLGLAAYELEITEDVFPELTTDREVARYGAAARPTVLHVAERYRIRGFDQEPAVEDLFLTFVQREDGWVVASDSDLDDLTLFSARKLWEFGPVVTRASEHFLYVSPPDLASASNDVLAAAEDGLDRVSTAWPLPWRMRHVILAPGGTEELRRLLQATFDLDVFVAFAASGIDRAEDWDLVGHRIILHWSNFSRHVQATRERILTHELAHIANRELAGPHVPTFVDEGVAEWVAGDASTVVLDARVAGGEFDRRLPAEHEFLTGSASDISNAYQESYTAIRYAAARFGPDAVAEFYRALGEVRLAPGTWRYHVGRAMRSAFGLGYEEFQRAWADAAQGAS